MITLTIPGEPVAKGRPRFSRRHGRAFTPAATRKAEETLAGRLMALVASQGYHSAGEELPLRGAVRLEVTFDLPVPASWAAWKREAALAGHVKPVARPDCDNYLKLFLDAANGVLWTDDSQVVEVTVRKRYGEQPCTEVRMLQMTSVATKAEWRAVGGGT